MICKRLEEQMNGQLNYELYSAYIYQAMSADFKAKGFNGFANWMQVQAQEELAHAMGFHNYILSRGGKVKLMKIDAPPTTWKSALDAFSHALEHEEGVTARINKLAKIARDEEDFAASNFMQWYVNEQVEEEENANEIVNQLRMVEGSKQGLFMIDKNLAARIFAMPNIPGGIGGAAA